MKVCARCGDVYRDCVDFCFEDGELLQTGPLVNDPVRFPPTRDLGSDPTLALIQQVAAAVAASVAAANADAPPRPATSRRNEPERGAYRKWWQ